MTTFVLVHGAWHGSWCWKRVRKALQAIATLPTIQGETVRARVEEAEEE